jgi:NAD(P)-dependent dehydrogenase (short-subunit alcohol dehydrogenase family)
MKKVFFITGASSGIGYALALELAKKNCRLALAARRREPLEDLSTRVKQLGGESLALGCDVGDPLQVKKAISETIRHFGRIDTAILSAGVTGTTSTLNFRAAQFERLLRTNVLGVAYCLEELIPIMQRQQSGVIAAISSLAGDRGIPGSAGYCATKSALSTLFDGLRVELSRDGIKLVTIEPGYVQTPMTEGVENMPFLMQADEAACLIIRRMERGDRVIRFPILPSIFMKVIKFLPVSLFDIVAAKRRPVRLRQVNEQ